MEHLRLALSVITLTGRPNMYGLKCSIAHLKANNSWCAVGQCGLVSVNAQEAYLTGLN